MPTPSPPPGLTWKICFSEKRERRSSGPLEPYNFSARRRWAWKPQGDTPQAPHPLLLGRNHNPPSKNLLVLLNPHLLLHSLTLGKPDRSLAAALEEEVRIGMGGVAHPVSHLLCLLSSTGLKQTETTGAGVGGEGRRWTLISSHTHLRWH